VTHSTHVNVRLTSVKSICHLISPITYIFRMSQLSCLTTYGMDYSGFASRSKVFSRQLPLCPHHSVALRANLLFACALFNDLLRNVRWHFLVLSKFHGTCRTALTH